MPRQKTDTLSRETVAQYLVAELEALTQRALHFEQTLMNKINFYLVVVTAVIGGLILLSQSDAIRDFTLPIAIIICLFLNLLGWTTLSQGLELSYTTIAMYRRSGRIRQWFVDHDSSLAPYIPFTHGDDRPLFYANYAPLRNIETILLLVNAAIAGILLSLTCLWTVSLLSPTQSQIVYLIILFLGLLTAFIVWKQEARYMKLVMLEKEQLEQKTGSIHFPSKLSKKSK